MGRTVEELTATLSHEELQEWIAFHDFEPFGAPVEDQRARISNEIAFKAGNFEGDSIPDYILFDRDPEETERIREKTRRIVELEQLRAFFESRMEKPSQ